MRAVLLDQAHAAVGVPERDEVLAEQPDPDRVAARGRDLADQQCGRPVATQQLTHGRPRPHAGQELVVLL
ncbi:hypothetical protein BJF78_36370 [Pseudonocardia sp. CNS-139]|nr:hypothetical protein BJF78_36370 [Pseudonocardia sp. CNS-139]